MAYYGHIIARLNGNEIESDFKEYSGLVRKGIAGFIIFGGEIEPLRECIGRLQGEAGRPLLVMSDLEQGLGRQVTGGTLFPPAMAMTSAVDTGSKQDTALIREVFTVFALEALYAGINTILAPVVDINTNPNNPIISVRSFGENKDVVSRMSGLMIETVQSLGVAACAKHFPGHGDTDLDSHLELPVLNKGMEELERREIAPFKEAVNKGVKTMMMGHISVPAIDPQGIPMSVSGRAVEYVRKELGFDGLLMTDALNMGGLSFVGGDEAGAMSLSAGVDVLLHPDDPYKLNSSLKAEGAPLHLRRIELLRKTLRRGTNIVPDFQKNTDLSAFITEMSIRTEGNVRKLTPSSLVVIREDNGLSYGIFERYLHDRFPGANYFEIVGEDVPDARVTGNNVLTVIYSSTAAWKGSAPRWLRNAIRAVESRTSLFAAFGNPYVVHDMGGPKLLTYWCSEQAEKAAAKRMRMICA